MAMRLYAAEPSPPLALPFTNLIYRTMYMRLLELFSGTHSVGKVAKELKYSVLSLDRDMPSDLNLDILDWDYREFPIGYFDVIWASPPCETFSYLRCSNIGRNGYTRESLEEDITERGVPILRRAEEIIDYFKPPLWFIENPQTGRMKDYVTNKPYYDVDYCRYCDWGVRKRTRIWTNKEDFTPLLCNRECGYIENGRHIMQVNSRGGGSDRRLRYRIPPELIRQLIN